ncbi:18335_t:CDS:10 [Dentiscutata erythropus]|uniref:26S proteasome regulatory subunit 6A n=1 Tax=Dentiscutata erythropus TaxID=1348616 RepID=A0A9N9G6H6_9GLOM|nr:18335_t:CDS:10 [Dentiscutata erythropus]
MTTLDDKSLWNQAEDGLEDLGQEILKSSTDDIINRTRLLENEIKVMKSEHMRLIHEQNSMKEKIKDNREKIKVNKQLPYLVGNVVELLDMDPNDEPEEDGANIDLDAHRKGKCAVIKTSTRQTIFLPLIGLVDPATLKPGDLIGVNKDSYLVLDTLPAEYDSRVKAMEVDEKPTEDYTDIGGLDKQIEELVEAIVLPMTHADRFKNLGIKPPKGVLMYGPPGTGKTLLARACAAQTNSTYLKLAGPQLVQMFIGDGAKLVRDAFNLAKEKAPSIIFIDELDAIGTKRFDSEKSGDREVQRTMLELLNQLDGFSSDERIKVIAATNRIDILDPALLRSGRLDRKIEFPLPNEEARARILQIHSRKMTVGADVNYDELARCCDEFNGAQCKAVCVEAGMLALRRNATELNHEDFMDVMPHHNSLEMSAPPTKANLKAWWKQFAARNAKREGERKGKGSRGIFGVDLAEGIEYARVPICMAGPDGKQYIYGYIPTIVAKCGMFLKEQGFGNKNPKNHAGVDTFATTTEGIFRLSGSAKRIKELQTIFDSPPVYGKTLTWVGYSVHDAANVLRRYLNHLPDKVIPLVWYDKFRAVHVSYKDAGALVENYQRLIQSLPKENQHLLLYILDLLAVFSSKSSQNLMPSKNLASIFQPGILSHPDHDMDPEQYKLSQEVVEFLIDYQNYFLMSLPNPDHDIPVIEPIRTRNIDPDTDTMSLMEPYDLNNVPITQLPLRRSSLSLEPSSDNDISLPQRRPSYDSRILSRPGSTILGRSKTLPNKRSTYRDSQNLGVAEGETIEDPNDLAFGSRSTRFERGLASRKESKLKTNSRKSASSPINKSFWSSSTDQIERFEDDLSINSSISTRKQTHNEKKNNVEKNSKKRWYSNLIKT